jgi:hypothetical protein
MRRDADAERVRRFMRELGRATNVPARLYLVGGASAVIERWRATTLDIDLRLEPDDDALLREIVRLKERLEVSVEFASPLDFLPELPGWRDRSPFLFREGVIDVFHLDFPSQALAKLERGFEQDLADVASMVDAGVVDPRELLHLYGLIEDQLFRFPAVDPPSLRAAVEGLASDD